MRVGQTDTEAVQTASLNHEPYFPHLRHSHLWQAIEQCKRLCTLLQRPKSKFCHDEGMDHNLPLVKMLAQLFVSRAEMVDPDRGVCENQCRRLRRGTFFNSGIVPPRDANLRALSLSIRALRASRINAVFSATPVNSWAVRTRSSSSATVVLIKAPGPNYSIK